MLRRLALLGLLSGAVGLVSGEARAGGAWLASGSLTPVEQRVAVAVGPARTTLWTSLRFEAAGGPVGIVVPAPQGASLDFSSDAWFEALEVATAPRIFPPSGVTPYCPGKSGPPAPFETVGLTSHTQSLVSKGVTVLDDAAAVGTWATQNGLVLPSKLAAALGALGSVRFVAVHFTAPSGSSVTPTLRISMPGTPAVLPLALTSAVGSDLQVTAWTLGKGEGDLIGAVKVAVSPSSLTWKASAQTSNYDALRDTALASGTDTFVVEAAGHAALVENTMIAQGSAVIDGVVTTYFERAAAYGDGAFDSAACITAATPLLDAPSVVAAACPRADLGVVPPAAPCTESPGPGEVDPAQLRCGAGADDLALALSGLTPGGAWVTRQSLVINAGAYGADTPIGFTSGATTSPVLTAHSVDVADCGDAGTHPGSSSSSGSTGTTSGGTGAGGTVVVVGGDGLATIGDVIDGVASASEGCSCADTQGSSDPSTGTSGDSCGGGSGGDSCSGSNSDGSSSDSCSNSSSSNDSCSNSSGGGESCGSGSSGGESCGSGSSGGESCGSSGGGSGCSGDTFKCATAGSRKARAPRLSILLMAALSILAPLRRRTRPRRRRA